MSAPEVILPQSAACYLREPRLVVRGGTLELHTLAWIRSDTGEHERHEVRQLSGTLEPSEPRVIAEGRALTGLSWSDEPTVHRAGEEVDADRLAESRGPRGLESVRVLESGGESRLILSRGRLEILVIAMRATVAAPAIATVASGTWLAFHHNRREDTGEADLAKWIALRFVDEEGRVFEPSAPMTDRERDARGEEQGFELPTLSVGDDGTVSLFGRGSHRFYRQQLDASGFSPRIPLREGPLDEGGWGCRGRRVAVRAVGGALVTARRDKRGIVLASLPALDGGSPALVPAEISLDTRPHRDVPRRPRGADPASRHGLRTLFGDIHQHSAHSDGCGTAHEPFLRARRTYGDDFCALSDHESFLGKRIGPGEWRYLQSVADAHDAPGEFAALHAYEWTGRMFPGPGHKVVYPLRSDHEIVSRDTEPTGAGLLARLRAQGAIAVPHHVGWTGADEAAHDPELQPVWEICSCHGCYLSEGHPLGQRGQLSDQMIEAVLRRGHKLGFIACSDGHGLLFHHGVGRKRDPFRCGLTAVQASEVSRLGVLSAIRDRRCYATSGVPIYLDVRANGEPMGSLHRTEQPVSIVIAASGSARIEELALVGPEGVIARVEPRSDEAVLTARTAARWSYARVVQEDGEMAWSSPVFIEPS